LNIERNNATCRKGQNIRWLFCTSKYGGLQEFGCFGSHKLHPLNVMRNKPVLPPSRPRLHKEVGFATRETNSIADTAALKQTSPKTVNPPPTDFRHRFDVKRCAHGVGDVAVIDCRTPECRDDARGWLHLTYPRRARTFLPLRMRTVRTQHGPPPPLHVSAVACFAIATGCA
jgi:hypothetical protein